MPGRAPNTSRTTSPTAASSLKAGMTMSVFSNETMQ